MMPMEEYLEGLLKKGVPKVLTEKDLGERVDAIVARCSKYSGWDLQWEWTEHGGIRICDPKATDTRYYSPEQVCKNHATLTVALYKNPDCCLREVYGRLRQWNITYTEQAFLEEAIKRRLDTVIR